MTQFEHCRDLPFQGKESKSEHDRNRGKVRLSQGQGRHVGRTRTAVDGNCHRRKYEQRERGEDWQGSEKGGETGKQEADSFLLLPSLQTKRVL